MTIHGLPSSIDDVVHGDHGGVLDPGRGAGLALHPQVDLLPFRGVQVVGDPRLLDRDLAVHDLVVRPPDRAHTAVAEPADEPIASADPTPLLGPAHRGWHRYRLLGAAGGGTLMDCGLRGGAPEASTGERAWGSAVRAAV